MMNKILHYNLLPRGAEKNPNVEKLAVLHSVMMRKALDIVLLIWEVMKEFAQARKPKANVPFGNLVTRLCDHFKVKVYVSNKMTPLETRAIGKASSSKRTTMSRGEQARVS